MFYFNLLSTCILQPFWVKLINLKSYRCKYLDFQNVCVNPLCRQENRDGKQEIGYVHSSQITVRKSSQLTSSLKQFWSRRGAKKFKNIPWFRDILHPHRFVPYKQYLLITVDCIEEKEEDGGSTDNIYLQFEMQKSLHLTITPICCQMYRAHNLHMLI